MEATRKTTGRFAPLRTALAVIIIATTLTAFHFSRPEAVDATATQTTTDTTFTTRAPAPSKPLLWIMGSTLLGLVGLKRFGLYRG